MPLSAKQNDRIERLRAQRQGVRPSLANGRSRRGGLPSLVPLLLICLLVVGSVNVAGKNVVHWIGTSFVQTSVSGGANNPNTLITFQIQSGDTLSAISKHLQSRGVILNSDLFYWYARLNNFGSTLDAGSYRIHASGSMDQIIHDFGGTTQLNGEGTGLLTVKVVNVTIPEGWRIEQIAERLAHYHVTTYADFVNQAKHGDFTGQYAFLKGRPKGATLEGYLYPNTYEFVVNGGARRAIAKMLDEFNTVVAPNIQAAFTREGLSFYQGVMLASLVQAEGRKPDDLPKIASVYMNRYHYLNHETQFFNVDAAVRYGLGYDTKTHSWWGPVDKTDFAINTPWNTYMHPGFPFGPICNPGLLSIQAAAHPANTDYQYYVATADGGSAFASTYSQFQQVEAANGYSTQ